MVIAGSPDGRQKERLPAAFSAGQDGDLGLVDDLPTFPFRRNGHDVLPLRMVDLRAARPDLHDPVVKARYFADLEREYRHLPYLLVRQYQQLLLITYRINQGNLKREATNFGALRPCESEFSREAKASAGTGRDAR